MESRNSKYMKQLLKNGVPSCILLLKTFDQEEQAKQKQMWDIIPISDDYIQGMEVLKTCPFLFSLLPHYLTCFIEHTLGLELEKC